MKGTILLADDSMTIQKVVELTFADTEINVVTVSSGDELLEQLPSVRPDIVISDVIMPGTDGYNVCQTIKSDPETLHIPVILLTGTFEPFDRDRALAAGCDEIITKPFEARKLVETVDRLLQGGPAGTPEEEAPAPVTYEGAVAPPAVTPEPAGEAAGDRDFGTRLAPPPFPEAEEQPAVEPPQVEPPEELDFTTSGFDRMRAAGEAQATAEPEIPQEGMEFDLEPVEPDEALGGQPAGEAFGGQTPAEEAGPFGTPSETVPPAAEEPSPFEVPGETGGPEPEPLPVPEPSAGPAGEQAAEAGISDAETGPVFVETPAAASAEEAPGPVPAGDEPAAPVEPEPADTHPSMDEAPTLVTGGGEGGPVRLSDEDVERIARKVLELAADRLERIAWEVIPDMAEIVVRERIRELEAEAGEETVQ